MINDGLRRWRQGRFQFGEAGLQTGKLLSDLQLTRVDRWCSTLHFFYRRMEKAQSSLDLDERIVSRRPGEFDLAYTNFYLYLIEDP